MMYNMGALFSLFYGMIGLAVSAVLFLGMDEIKRYLGREFMREYKRGSKREKQL